MARVLVVVPPLTGHINPTLAVGAELRRRGHDVRWTGVPDVARMLPPDAPFSPCAPDMGDTVEAVGDRAHGLRGAAALKFLWEDVLVPLGHHMAPGLDSLVGQWDPDVVLSDQQALAGAVVSIRRAVPWATSATTSAQLTDPLAALPKVKEWLDEQLIALSVAAGMSEAEARAHDLVTSPHLVVAFTTEALAGPAAAFPEQVRFVGPSIADRVEDTASFPWDHLDGGPGVLVSLGTLNAEAGARFWAAATEAFRSLDARGVFVAPPELAPDPPANVIVRPRVPQLAVLRRVEAVVSHAGHNTVCESLAAGLPMVLAPIRDDQPIVADQVVSAGAGIRLKFGRIRPEPLAEAITSALADPALRAGAARVRDSFAAAGGPSAAADHLEALLR